jgi:hypothetical protein
MLGSSLMPAGVVARFRPPWRGAGSLTRYYHFIFDQLWPLFELIDSGKIGSKTTVFVKDSGPFVDWLPELLDHDVASFQPGQEPFGLPTLEVVGKNPKVTGFSARFAHHFRHTLFDRLGVPARDANSVLLIERSAPLPFHATPGAPGFGGGVTRRSLENHQDLREALAVHYGDAFQNVILEGRSLKDQLELFRGARLVIGQHGAGLANSLWLEPGATVVELDDRRWTHRHFKNLARYNQLGYHRFWTDSNHPTIEPARFLSWLDRCRLT